MTKIQIILVNILLVIINFQQLAHAYFSYGDPASCINPNGRSGKCVSIYTCPAIINILETRQPNALAFVRKCECEAMGQGRRPYVCCTADTGFRERTNTQPEQQRIVFPEDKENIQTPQPVVTPRTPDRNQMLKSVEQELFPKPPVCGPIAIGNKIYGGEETELGEFSWLANLEYTKITTGELVSVCAANIINERYLLTAAHCIVGEIEVKVGKLVSARVGDHNTQTSVDCNNAGCLDPFQRVGIDKLIVHQGYGNNKVYHNHHDIALIKTNRNMLYSVSVAPICLPDALPQLPELKSGLKLSVAGWGHTGFVKFTAEKRKVDLPYVETQNCQMNIAPEQLCAGGEFRKDSCSGDSGGGLVLLTGDSWVIEGIVSFGRGCGLEKPGVYTRVRSYIPWIHENVLP